MPIGQPPLPRPQPRPMSDFCSDIHLVEIRHIQREQRKPLINWYAVIGLGIMIASATLVIWCFAKVLDTL